MCENGNCKTVAPATKPGLDVTCQECNTVINLDVTFEQVMAWRKGELIQFAMPNLTADERELLISGTCGECFDKMFA